MEQRISAKDSTVLKLFIYLLILYYSFSFGDDNIAKRMRSTNYKAVTSETCLLAFKKLAWMNVRMDGWKSLVCQWIFFVGPSTQHSSQRTLYIIPTIFWTTIFIPFVALFQKKTYARIGGSLLEVICNFFVTSQWKLFRNLAHFAQNSVSTISYFVWANY
jgi:hypothetical protein